MASQPHKSAPHNPVVLIWPDNVYLWADDVRPGDLDHFDADYSVVNLDDPLDTIQWPDWLITEIQLSNSVH